MNSTNWLTVIGGAIITILPTITSVIPAPYSEIASGLLAAAVAAWHLYQPAPSASMLAK
jgi:hypothetical protein